MFDMFIWSWSHGTGKMHIRKLVSPLLCTFFNFFEACNMLAIWARCDMCNNRSCRHKTVNRCCHNESALLQFLSWDDFAHLKPAPSQAPRFTLLSNCPSFASFKQSPPPSDSAAKSQIAALSLDKQRSGGAHSPSFHFTAGS